MKNIYWGVAVSVQKEGKKKKKKKTAMNRFESPIYDASFEKASQAQPADLPEVEKYASITDYNELEKNSSGSIKQGELKRTFSLWSILGIGFGLTNSWFGISASLVTGISSGGPMLIVYGIIIIAFMSYCIGATLSELSSAIPSAGGQYVWIKVLSLKKYSGFLAYMCGSFAWAGAIFTSASMALSVAEEIMGLWMITHPDHNPARWELFVTYQLVNVVLFVFNCYGKLLPFVANYALYISLFSFLTITITVLACAKGHYQSSSFVFLEFDNATGWQSNGLAFIVGLINPNWSFSCLDSATHLAEEVLSPEKDIPIAIMGTVTIGLITSLCYVISMFFSIRDLHELVNSNSEMPIFGIYQQALQNNAGAICLGVLILLTGCGCTVSSHTWQARLCWSFSRDNGLPFSKYLSIIDPKLGVPLYAHIFLTFWVAVLGCLYLVSDSAFNSIMTGCISFLLLSYMLPTLSLLIRGRKNIRHGPFWLGNFGYFCNIVTCLWAIFALVFYCFPSTMPVTGNTMNYVCVLIFAYLSYCLIYWWFPIKKWSCRANFAGGQGNEEEEFSDVVLK